MSDPQPATPYNLPPAPPSRSSGKGCLKVAGIGCGVLVLLAIIAVAAMAFWLHRNGDTLKEGSTAAAEEGRRFGEGTDQEGCLAEGSRRAQPGQMPSLTKQMQLGVFVRACLESSRETPGFCEGVPAPTAIGRSATWKQERCGNDVGCLAVIPVAQMYCADPSRPRAYDSTMLKVDTGAVRDSTWTN